MTNDIYIVVYAIQAAIRLGRKVRTVFEEETRDRDLILPPIETPDLPQWGVVKVFFEGEGKAFVADPARHPWSIPAG